MRVLIVEDEILVRQDLAETLRAAGYVVEQAANGGAAPECMHSCRPDIVLLDLRMSLMNGFQFHQECRKDPALAAVPVILISANSNDEEARAIGAFASVDKLRKTQLLEAVARVVGPG